MSFVAGWAQMLVYIVTVAVSAFFVPHYLSIFWEPLKTNPWDIVGGVMVIGVLVALNVVGVQEAAKLSIRSIGYAILEEAERRNVDLIVLGSSPRWRRQSRFFSPTVDFVLRNAPCEVLVVAFPDGVFEE